LKYKRDYYDVILYGDGLSEFKNIYERIDEINRCTGVKNPEIVRPIEEKKSKISKLLTIVKNYFEYKSLTKTWPLDSLKTDVKVYPKTPKLQIIVLDVNRKFKVSQDNMQIKKLRSISGLYEQDIKQEQMAPSNKTESRLSDEIESILSSKLNSNDSKISSLEQILKCDSVKQLQQRLICPVCLDRYKQPKLLPCQHTFCLSPCLNNLADRVTNRIKCPECRTIHTLPYQGVDALPNNLTLLKFLDLDFETIPSNCNQCERKGQNSKCPDCGKYFCQNCKLIHLAHLQNEIRIRIMNIRKSLHKSFSQSYVVDFDLIKKQISNLIEGLINDIRNRESTLYSELEFYKQSNNGASQNKVFHVDLNSFKNFCDSADSIINTNQAINENQLAHLKKQSQFYLDELNKTNPSISNKHNLLSVDFSAENLNELKMMINKFGLIKSNNNSNEVKLEKLEIKAPINNHLNDSISSNPSESQTQRQRATWNKAPAIGFTIDLSPQNNQHSNAQSSRVFKPEPMSNSLVRSKTFVISKDIEENPNQPIRSVDIKDLYNVKPQTRAKTPLAFNVLLDESSNKLVLDESDFDNSKPNELLLVTDYFNSPNHHFIDYSLKTKAKKIIGKQGKENGEFTWPLDCCINNFNSHVYVTDSSNHRVQIFDQEGNFLKSFSRPGSRDGELNSPAGIFIDSMSNIFVVDRLNHRIQIFDRYCRFLRSIGSGQGNQPGHLNYPWGIAVNKISEIFVCDKENDRICVFHLSGRFLRSFGQHGSGHGSFDKPCYLHLNKENMIFVSDCMNHRVQVFDMNGKFIYSFGCEGSSPGEFKQPRGITSDRNGFILVADSGNSRIQVFKTDGTYVTHFGSNGTESGKFKGLEGMKFNKTGDLFVCDKENNRVQVF
ncbi:unnamed protein product, partial [Brachionus calyciflorus]